MFLLDGPYISDYLLDTLQRRRFPVIATEYARTAGKGRALAFVDEAVAVQRLENGGNERLYTPSENSIGWIAKHLGRTDLPEKISRFKNKAKFRAMIRQLYPEFYFREVDIPTLLSLQIEDLPLPCVVKPTTGFFSLGVYAVTGEADFARMKQTLTSDVAAFQHIYPDEVLNTQTFIIEEYIEGEEYAIDACFDETGEPVILGIFQHIFASAQDVSDRVYMTSAGIVRRNLAPFAALLRRIGALAGIRCFPMHVELRRRPDGVLIPIEINPMRFGGWCSTPDLAHYAWGMNVYEQYLLNMKPDWPRLIAGIGESVYSLIVLDNSTGFRGDTIGSFDYEAVLGNFSRPLELRKTDFRRYPIFGFLFAETSGNNTGELERILQDSLKSYISVA